MEPFKEKAVGCGLVGGIVLAVLSLVVMFTFAGAGVMHGTATRNPVTDQITDPGDMKLVPLALLGVAVGVVLVGASLGYGLWVNANANRGARRVLPNARIIARYAISGTGQMLTQEYEIETADRPRFYVRMQTGPGPAAEYECAPEMFFQCGEGMFGEAEFQGKWIGRFTPYIGLPPTS